VTFEAIAKKVGRVFSWNWSWNRNWNWNWKVL